MTTVILAEKPNQAKDYAASFSKCVRMNGYYEVEDKILKEKTLITYCIGHLVQLVSPGDYNEKWENWDLKNLPMIPSEYKYEVDPEKKKQFSVVKKLLNEASTIVIATDCDREGESIAWTTIIQAGAFDKNKKEYKRLWINSLEKDVIYEGFKNLKPGFNYFNKFKEAQSRQIGDWLIGMNGSPLYSLLLSEISSDRISLSTGRVQTPTLYMIYNRQQEIENFVKQPYFIPDVTVSTGSKDSEFKATLLPQVKYSTEAVLLDFLKNNQVKKGKQKGQITEIEKTEKQTSSPKLYSLSALQSKMNKKLGASTIETLQAAQGLYEKEKLLTYPRTSSEHITENEFAYLKNITGSMKEFLNVSELGLPNTQPDKRYVDGKKVVEHYAIIPTKKIATASEFQSLTPLQKEIYTEIVKVTLAMFADKYHYEETNISLKIGNLEAKAGGNIPLKAGWKEIFSSEGDSDKEENDLLPLIEKNQAVEIDIEVVEKETQPPKYYTEGTLLTAMKAAGKVVDSDESKKILKDIEGIGTEATRASIIEKLKNIGYIEVVKNNLVVTTKGQLLCKAVKKQSLLTSPEMTASWENYLKKIGEGDGNQEVFVENIKKYVKHLVASVPEQIKETDISSELNKMRQEKAEKEEKADMGMCPKCKKGHVKKYVKLAKCSEENCDFQLWLNMAGKKLSDKQVRDLVKHGTTGKKVTGFKGKKGKFDAIVILDPNFKPTFEFEKKEK